MTTQKSPKSRRVSQKWGESARLPIPVLRWPSVAMAGNTPLGAARAQSSSTTRPLIPSDFALSTQPEWCLPLAYSKPADCLLAVGDPKRLRVLSADAPRVLQQIDLPYRCGFVAAHPLLPIAALSGKTQSTGSNDRNQVLFVSIRTGAILGGLQGGFQRGFQLAFSNDGQTLYMVAAEQRGNSMRHSIRAVSTAGLSEQRFVPAHPPTRTIFQSDGALKMALAPHTKRLAVMESSGQVTLLDWLAMSKSINGPATRSMEQR